MDPDRWRRIEELVEATAVREGAERAAFLAEACAGDDELRREVESLLAEQSGAAGFLASDAWRPPALAPGTRLGPHEIIGLIGAGGMGEVYKARDTRLDRIVAVKILPPDVNGDPERRARFTREAKTISQLSHPNICTLFDIGEAGLPSAHPSTGSGWPELVEGQRPTPSAQYLVMEFLEGESLAARLTKGPLPLAQALELGAQIAGALAAAHKHGVVHRDLKPGNVMLTSTGVKLLDFGLAKLRAGSGLQAPDYGPTTTDPLTGRGVIVGTLPYMAPEQLEGKPADARTDLWALGTILYEMLSGKRAFEGDTSASLIGAILEREPEPVSARQPLTPPALDRLVRKCLAKAPDERWESAHDVADELRWIAQAASVEPARAPVRAGRPPLKLAGIALVVVAAAVAGAFVARRWSPAGSTPASVVRSQLSVAPADGIAPYWEGRPRLTALAVSPDGRTVVFAGREGDQTRLYRRALDQDRAVPLAGTEGAEGPFFSPDGRWIGFWGDPVAGQSGPLVRWVRLRSLFKVPSDGGVPMSLCKFDAPGVYPFGASWGDDEHIVFATPDGLWRVQATGGVPVRLPSPQASSTRVGLPHVLPGSRAVLLEEYPVGPSAWDPDRSRVALQDLPDGPRRTLVDGASDARYLPTGGLLYATWGRVFVRPFDLATLTFTGPAVAVLGDVMQSQNSVGETSNTGAAQVTVSRSGTLAYIAGGVVPDRRDQVLAWRNASGGRELLPSPAGDYFFLAVSPDGRRAVFRRRDRGKASLWAYDLERGTVNRLTHNGYASWPLWTLDGRRIVMGFEDDEGTVGVAWIPADGSQPPEWIVKAEDPLAPCAWTPDGRTLIVHERKLDGRRAILLLSPNDGQDPVLHSWRDVELPDGPTLSKDGRWLAYSSSQTGRREVYIEAFAKPGDRTQVSSVGGSNPIFAPDGRTLYFIEQIPAGGYRMMAAELDTRKGLHVGNTRTLFEAPWMQTYDRATYNLSPDGHRFLMSERLPASPPSTPDTIYLIQNWFEELKTRVGGEH